MVIIAMVTFPPEGSKEIGKRLKGQAALPDYIKMKGPYICGVTGEGIRSLSLYECDRSKLPDAIEIVTNRYVNYFGVPGLTHSVNVWLEATEALKMIGLA
jgi:hypothetical protein